MSSRRLAIISIITSLVLHLLIANRLGSLAYKAPVEEKKEEDSLELIPFKLEPKQKPKPNQGYKDIVEVGETPQEPDESMDDSQADYLSNRRMRTEKETVARFSPAPGQPSRPARSVTQPPKKVSGPEGDKRVEPTPSPEINSQDSDMQLKLSKEPAKKIRNQDDLFPTFEELAIADSGRPGSPNIFPDVPIGDMSFLNTDYYKYADFYNRLRRTGNFFWSKEIRALYGRVSLPSRDLVVYLNVAVYADGKLKSVSVNKSSGIPALDRAAIATVQQMTPIYAIPKELLNENQLFEGVWGFTLYFN